MVKLFYNTFFAGRIRKMKKLLQNKLALTIISMSTIILSTFMLVLSYCFKGVGNKSIWSKADFLSQYDANVFCGVLIVLFVLMILAVIGSIVSVFFKKRIGLLISAIYNCLLSLIMILGHLYLPILKAGSIVCVVFALILSILGFVSILLMSQKTTVQGEHPKSIKRFLLIVNTLSLVLLFTIFLIPIYSTKEPNGTKAFTLFSVLSGGKSEVSLYFIFLIFFITFFASLLFYISTLPDYFNNETPYIKKTRFMNYLNMAISVAFFITGFIMTFSMQIKGTKATTTAVIPLILLVILALIQSVLQGKYFPIQIPSNSEQKKALKFEPLIYIFIFTILIFMSLFLNIIDIQFEYTTVRRKITFTGLKLLTDYGNLGGGYQLLAFVLFLFLLSSAILCVICLISFFSKYKDHRRVIKLSAILNMIFLFILGISAIYFQISQKINEDNIISILEAYHLPTEINYTYKIQSQSIYLFLVGLVVFSVMMVRGCLNSLEQKEISPSIQNQDEPEATSTTVDEADKKEDELESFDACPAFTEIDLMHKKFEALLLKKQESEFVAPSLPRLVRFVVEYAKNSRLHLSYTPEDIATFVAGLGASRLAILQGMSGTGKTSLPKIFMEAIMGQCEIIEVESSWRDKNELLGYYNEFSKRFTPKKFTQALYKAKLNAEVPTFIVLDEMNLSRIEYYFSDFLSLMENEEDKRELKLLNLKIYRTINNKNIAYRALKNGHTLPIPTNVWFIGTANRDESTFEISDKVYDRAQTMNFNKRAPKITSFGEALNPQFVSYSAFNRLLKEAKENGVFDAEDNPLIQKVEALLLPYNISFGNRILRQMEDFVKIYCACFDNQEKALNVAIEKILFSKVVSKLEYKNVENKEMLALEFDQLKLYTCSQFIRKLNED